MRRRNTCKSRILPPYSLCRGEKLARLVQELERVDFAQEPDVVSEVGEERVLGEFRVRDGALAGAERVKAVESFFPGACFEG